MDPASEKPTMRFLSFANNIEDAEKEAKLKEAALKIEQAISKQKALGELIDYVPTTEKLEIDLANDTRSLFDRLQEQKDKKREALEDSQKMSNLITRLDEEDVSYLEEVARNRREEEIKKRLEVYDALEGKKRLDERKILEEEKRLKESLIGSHSLAKKSLMKAKLSLSIKMKPKSNTQGPIENSEQKLVDNDEPAKSSRSTQGNNRSDNESSANNSKRELRNEDNDQMRPKRQRLDDVGGGPDKNNSFHSNDGEPECSCSPKNIMKCIGILPSLPIIDKFEDSSDSNESNDDLEGRITLKISRNK